MKLLAIDSATERLALAAVEWDGPETPPRIDAADLDGGPAASALALPALQQLLLRRGWTFTDLDAIAFGQGPGGFTGLRTACAVAQGLAWGRGLPVLPVDSLLLVADDAAARCAVAAGETVWAAMDARMDEIYAASYRRDAAGNWQVLDAPMLVDAPGLQRHWQARPPALVCGNALAAFAGRLDPGGARIAPAEGSRAQALGRLAASAWARGEARPAAQALPVYLRDKVAQTTAERAATKSAQARKLTTADPSMPPAPEVPR